MTKPTHTTGTHERPKPQSLSRAMGPLPIPPRLGRPPALRVIKPAPPSHTRPSTATPRAPQVSKPVSAAAHGLGVAGRLGAFAATPLKSVQPPKRGKRPPA